MFGFKPRLKKYKFKVDNRLKHPAVKDCSLELIIKAKNQATAEATAAELGFAWHTLLTGPK